MLEDLRLQEEEVVALVRLHLDSAEALYKGAGVLAEEWIDGRKSPIRVRLADFVPQEGGYLLRAARTARKILAGELPELLF